MRLALPRPVPLRHRALAAAGALAVAATVLAAPPPAGAAQADPAPDRYDLAKGCWALRATNAAPAGGWLARGGGGFTATAADVAAAEPFHLEPTELGVYLLYGAAEDFAGSSGGTMSVEEAPASTTEWIVDAHADGGFTLHLFSSGDGLLAAEDGSLSFGPSGNTGPERRFVVAPHTGCATWPEVEVNVEGPVHTADTTTEEARGYIDAHLHHMGFEFLGGAAHCGRPWHRYGVAHALVDCPDHEGNGAGAVLENFLRNGSPVGTHDTVGWPTFVDWPAHDSLTHEQTYWKWMERAWRGGLRLYVQLNVENAALCDIYPIKRHGCNEMESVRRQLQRIHELENYVDAQYGGPGEGFLRIVTDPFEAREAINDGKLAVVLGIEVSSVFDCKLLSGMAQCTPESIDEQIAEFWDAGVRQMELSNKFDNALAGVAGDAGATGVLVNTGQFQQTGRWWDMRTCEIPEGVAVEDFHDHDKPQSNLGEFPEQDAIFGAINDLYGPGAVAPVYTDPPHCNALGLSELGVHTLDRLADLGMLIDPDHMGVLARTQALEHLDARGYEGVLSSHSWSTPAAYEQILEMGGFLAAIPGRSLEGWVADWRDYRSWADDRYVFGMGYGADNNGFATQPGPFLDHGLTTPITYPFTGFGGVTVHQQVSGERVYDANVDGVAHYGLYPDFWHAAQQLGGPELKADMERAPEAYLQVWERAWGIAGDSCRDDVPDLTAAQVAALRPGTLWIDVLRAVGQPNTRIDQYYTYCVEGGRTVQLEFDADDRLIGGAPAVAPAPGPLPATGGGLAVLGLALGAVATAASARRGRSEA